MTKNGLLQSILFCLLTHTNPVWALNIDLPSNARLTFENQEDPDNYALPIGPFSNGAIAVQSTTGNILRQSWRIEGDSQSTLQILSDLRSQLENDSFNSLFECQSKTCGGFDFRFGIEIIPAPDMHVDLFDYRFLAASQSKDSQIDYVSLLISRSTTASYVQIIHVAPSGTKNANISSSGAVTVPTPKPAQIDTSMPLLQTLEAIGHVVLSDLTFETGSSKLGKGPFASLDSLAGYLKTKPSRKVVLVGHTDTEGSLSGNITLSKRRASSVVDRLIETHDIPRDQVSAEGMGYLSPIASNLTKQGREENRRVEVILLNTE